MGKLQTSRFERLGARTYSIKGPGALVDLDETVLGVIQLERQGGMESHVIQEWDTFGKMRSISAQVGEFTWMALTNPIGTGRLLVVDSWSRSETGVHTYVAMSRGLAPGFAVLPVGVGLDTRIPFARQPAGSLLWNHDLSGTFGNQIEEVRSTELQERPFVLAPDGTLYWRSGVVNEAMTISVRWAERDAAPFEL